MSWIVADRSTQRVSHALSTTSLKEVSIFPLACPSPTLTLTRAHKPPNPAILRSSFSQTHPRLIFILALWHLTRELRAFWLRPARFAVISTYTCIGAGTPALPPPSTARGPVCGRGGKSPHSSTKTPTGGNKIGGASMALCGCLGCFPTIEVGNAVCRPNGV